MESEHLRLPFASGALAMSQRLLANAACYCGLSPLMKSAERPDAVDWGSPTNSHSPLADFSYRLTASPMTSSMASGTTAASFSVREAPCGVVGTSLRAAATRTRLTAGPLCRMSPENARARTPDILHAYMVAIWATLAGPRMAVEVLKLGADNALQS